MIYRSCDRNAAQLWWKFKLFSCTKRCRTLPYTHYPLNMPNASLNFGFDYRTFFFITKRFSGNCILHLPWIVSYNPYVHFVHVNEPPTSTWSKVVHFILIFFFSLIVNWNVKNSRKSFWKRYKLNQFLINLNPVCCSLKLNKVDAMLKCKIQREKRNKPEIN